MLFNILTNEYITIKCEIEKLKKIVETMIFTKYVNIKSISDEDFIIKNKNILMKYKWYYKIKMNNDYIILYLFSYKTPTKMRNYFVLSSNCDIFKYS